MHSHSMDSFRHPHVFLGDAHEHNERKTWAVIAICAAMMVAEIAGGLWFGSVALIADGLHMSTHAGALLIAALAYTYSRHYAADARLAFGTGKLGDLAAFTSAIVLAMIALLIGYESLQRLADPVPIAFDQAIPIAVVGLAVNLLSAYLLRDDHHHAGAHDHEHRHAHDDDAHGHAHDAIHVHRDHNLRAAFVHVMADVAVSVLVIIGLVAGRQFGWLWLDPVMGLVATVVILSWSWTLIRSSGSVLLDVCPDPTLSRKITARLEQGSDRVSDLHLWRLGPGHLAAVISIVTHEPRAPDVYKRRLAGLRSLSHLTIEVLPCPGTQH
jgi:cation diffusion facilitator family transporter